MSSTFQQRLARRRHATMMKRGSPAPPPKIVTSPKATSVPLGAMSPPQEMRVKLLPRIAEYRAKGYISPKQEAQLHQKLSSRPKQFGETSDAIALEVSTALDQAKERQQHGQTTTSGTASSATNVVLKPSTTNSRSLFRKQPPADLTLANKLSYRRKSAMMDLSVDADDDDDDKTIDTKDLSVFAKKGPLTSPTINRPTTPVRQKKEILARARARRETTTPTKAKSAVSEKTPSITSSAEKARKRFLSSSLQPQESSAVVAAKYKADAQKYNAAMTAATTTSTTSVVPRKEMVSMARSIYAKQAAKEHSPLKKTQSARSVYGNQNNKQLDRPSVLSSSTRSLDVGPSKEQELPVLKAGPATTGNARIIYSKVTSKPAMAKEQPSSPTTKNASGNLRSVYAKAQKTQQASPTSISSRKLQSSIHAAKIQTAAAEEAPTRPASPRRSQSSIYAKLEKMQEMTERLAAASPVRSRVVSEREPTDPLSSPSSKDPRLESARSIYAKVQKKKALKDPLDASDASDREQENVPGQTVHNPLHIRTDIAASQTQGQSQQQVLRESPRSPNRSRKQQIYEPGQMWQDGSISSEEEIRDLFVEMAFFARLGFVQPPSCLSCVYRESIENRTPDMDCKRFVPWRKNANTEIHPNRLDDNIVLVQCRAARTLVQGKQVEHYQWDGIRRRLVNR